MLALSVAEGKMRSGHEGATFVANLPVREATPLAYRFVPGERMVFTLKYTSTSSSDFGVLFQETKPAGEKEQAKPSGLAHSFKTTVRGELLATVLDKKAESVLIAYSLRKPVVRLIANKQEAVTQAETIRTSLGREGFSTVNLQGRVLSVRFDPAVDNVSQSFARALLAITQFVFPSSQVTDLRQWEAEEDDPNGQYIASYQVETDSSQSATGRRQVDVRTFRKTKLRYLQPRQKPAPGEFEVPMTIKPEGALIGRFDLRGGHLVSLSGSERQVIVIAGKTVASAENTLRMNYLRKETLSQRALSALLSASAAREKVAQAVPLSVTESKEASEASIQRTELGSATLESLLADLAKAEASKDETFNETPLYLKFKALVYLHPESCASLGKMLTTADPKGLTMRILTGALGAVGHAEAQAALVIAIRARPEDWPALSTLIPTLGLVRSPTELAEDTLRDLAFNSPNPEIASTAQLALGAMARTLAETSPERAANIVKWAIEKIESSPSKDMTRQLLLVLGNAGSTLALPTITRFLSDPAPELRAAAALALRWVEAGQADALLIKALTSDLDATVRSEAAGALGFREMTAATFEAQKGAFLTEKDVNVRLALLSNLWKAHEVFPEVRQLVKQAAEKDPSEDVRKAAADIIARYPEGYFK